MLIPNTKYYVAHGFRETSKPVKLKGANLGRGATNIGGANPKGGVNPKGGRNPKGG